MKTMRLRFISLGMILFIFITQFSAQEVFGASYKNVMMSDEGLSAWDGEGFAVPEISGHQIEIDSAYELAWFANEVNSGNTFDGKSIIITGKIDLNDEEWIVIGRGDDNKQATINAEIYMVDVTISGLSISKNNSKNRGLFGSVRLKKLYVDNLILNGDVKTSSVDFYGISNAHTGLLFGYLHLQRFGICEIKNCEIGGHIHGLANCGALFGKFVAGTESSVWIENSDFALQSLEYGSFAGYKYNCETKGTVIGHCDSDGRIVLNGVSAHANLLSANKYGYDTCVAGGIIGVLEGASKMYVFRCDVDGYIESDGYCGFAGGIIGKYVEGNIYKQKDTLVTADIKSIWNVYGYQYNAGVFFDGPYNSYPEGYIKNSYYAGNSSTATAFIGKDSLGGSDCFKIYNCYYNKDTLTNHVFHANFTSYEITKATIDCAGYSSNEMLNESNFVGWDFENVWRMGEYGPVLNEQPVNLPEEFDFEQDEENSQIVKIVRKYASNKIYKEWENIWLSREPEEVKFEKIIDLTLNYGISDPKEGLEFVVNSKEKRWAYNFLTTDDCYTAQHFLNWLDDGGRVLLAADGLIFNGEIGGWTDASSHISFENPEVKKYKEFLYKFMNDSSKKYLILENIQLVSTLSKKVTSYAEKTYVNDCIKKLNCIEPEEISAEECYMEMMKIHRSLEDKGVYLKSSVSMDEWTGEMYYTYKLDETSGFGQFAKKLGYIKKGIDLYEMGLDDIQDIILMDSGLKMYYQYEKFLNDIIDAKDELPWTLVLAARLVKDELTSGYGTIIKNVGLQILDFCSVDKSIKDFVFKKQHITCLSDVINIVSIEAWILNQFVDVGAMVREAYIVEGYAYLSKMYKNRLNESTEQFLENQSESNAWSFYYDYSFLYCMREQGEKAYLELCNIKGWAGKLFSYGYDEKSEITQEILTSLKELCKFNLDDEIVIPKDMEFVSKLVVSCPVNVLIYSEDNNLICSLEDGVLMDETNEYGRFVVSYNHYCGEYQKVLYLKREDVRIKVLAQDSGLVNILYSHVDEQGEITVKHQANQPMYQGNWLNILPSNLHDNDVIEFVDNNQTRELILVEQDSTAVIESFRLSKDNVLMSVGEEQLLEVIVSPENAEIRSNLWCTSNSDVVTIKDGKLKAIHSGNANVYCFLTGVMTPMVCAVTVHDGGNHTHVYNGWRTDDDYHWMTCEDVNCIDRNASIKDWGKHVWGSWNVLIPPTAENTGIVECSCISCGKKKEEIIPRLEIPTHSHFHFYDAWKYNDDYHWKECTASDCDNKAGSINEISLHNWDRGTISRVATVFENGEAIYRCIDCGKTKRETIEKLTPTGKLSKSTVTLSTKKSYLMRVTGLANGDEVKKYSSSNRKIFTVTQDGKIIARGNGNGKLTVTLASGKKLTATIKVRIKTKSITVNRKKIVLRKGECFQIKSKITPKNSLEKISYVSERKAIATVSKKGKIFAKKKGVTYVTVNSGKKSVKIKVTVQ